MRRTRAILVLLGLSCAAASCNALLGLPGDYYVADGVGDSGGRADGQTGDGAGASSSGTASSGGPTDSSADSSDSSGGDPCGPGAGSTCPPGQCSAACCAGCCHGTTCVPVCMQTNSQCGAGGASCKTCSATQFCSSGACAAAPPSCAVAGDGRSNCGGGSESCCTSLPVVGGTYYRSYGDLDGGFVQADPATVSDFRLDKYEVTVGRFRLFAAAWGDAGTGWLPGPGAGKHVHLNAGQGLANAGDAGSYEPGWNAGDDKWVTPQDTDALCSPSTWTAGTDTLPMNCVNWYEAYAFCIWDEGFLPSEAEWKYAATGGSQQRLYPWGDASAGTANQYAIYGCDYPAGADAAACPSLENIAPVGTAVLGAGMWGQLDQAGNLRELVLDWSEAHYRDPCIDCAVTSTDLSSERSIRGGFFAIAPPSIGRSYTAPTNRHMFDGFRCARTP